MDKDIDATIIADLKSSIKDPYMLIFKIESTFKHINIPLKKKLEILSDKYDIIFDNPLCPNTDIEKIVEYPPSSKEYTINEEPINNIIENIKASDKSINETIFQKAGVITDINMDVDSSSKNLPISNVNPASTTKEKLLIEKELNRQKIKYQGAQIELLNMYINILLTTKLTISGKTDLQQKTVPQKVFIEELLKMNDPALGPFSDIDFVKMCIKNKH